MLGSITAGLSVATSKDTHIVMAGGYKIGAGSKSRGIVTGNRLEGVPRRYSEAATLKGYRKSSAVYESPKNM